MIWQNSKMDSLYYTKHAAEEGTHCIVKITDDEILVEYEGDDGLRQYVGKNSGDGHFELHTPDGEGQATLHQSPNSEVLEGSWIEAGERGMWRIELG
ncbi:MAG: hypothetical protein KBH99_07640 [Syntrophobacteraceae bacterium]|nr:hypothetical protein [Syntrophobacteraceae bacterium]